MLESLAVRIVNQATKCMGWRLEMAAVSKQPGGWAALPLRVQTDPKTFLLNGMGSTFEAGHLRDKIDQQFRHGSPAVIMAKYSFYGLDDAWATYHQMEAAKPPGWLTWGTAALAGALLVALWQSLSLRNRKRTQRIVRDSEEHFRAIFQHVGVGIAQISLEGTVELANDQYCEVVGHSRQNLLEKGTLEITHREDLRQQLAMLPRLLAGEIQSFSTEKRYIRYDGTIIWAKICKSLVRDAHGMPKCFIAVVEDITEQKQNEAALKESEERFRNMADSAPVLIWVSGLDNVRKFFNRRWLDFTGRTMEQEAGDGWLASVHPDDLERTIAVYAPSFEKSSDFQKEYRLRRADGVYRDILDHGVARFSPDGAFAGYIGSCVDISDLKRNYEQHLATQKLESLGVLAAGVAHDFNNLLGAIVASAESAQSELESGSPANEDVSRIRVTALRAAEIVSQMMTFASQENTPATTVDLSSLVAEMLELIKVSIAKGAVLKTELASDLPLVRANAAEIRQVVMNLMINASEALDGKPGCIAVVTAPVLDGGSAPSVRLEVQDTGSGMTEDVKARIFDPFFTTRFAGRGLGLSAVQGIVRRHAGSIEVESAPGHGSRFTVRLPSVGAQVASGPRNIERGVLSAKVGAAVLFIEDEDSLRSVVAKALRRRKFQVVEAADGAAAIEILKSDRGGIGVVILDVTLPGISGAELLNELRTIQPGIKVILSTAYSRETAMRGFDGRDIWGFIRKPYRTDDLIKLLQEAADGNCVAADF